MWNKRHGCLLFLNSFSSGLTVPLLSLLLLAMGCTLSTLPLVVGLYSAVVIAFEVPSGIYADRRGRKHSFLLSLVLSLPALALFVLGRGMAAAVCAMVFMGLSRAFSSGSLDALTVDDFLQRDGGDALPRCIARMSILGCLGLAAGSLAGGGLYGLWGLGAAIGAKGFVTALMLVLAAGLTEPPRTGQSDPTVGDWRALWHDARAVRPLVAIGLLTGALLFSVELFWQPRFTQLLDGAGAGWLLGVLGASSYFAAAAGTALGQRLTAKPRLGLLLLSVAAGGGALALLSRADAVVWFLLGYALYYLTVGWADLLSSTLMNQAVPSDRRATLLSLSSFCLQLGGVGTSLLLSAGMTRGTIPQVWLAVGLLAAAIAAVAALVLRRKRSLAGAPPA